MLGFWTILLSRRDWVYVLSLLVPFIVYNLTLKAWILSSRNVDTAGEFNIPTHRILAYGMWSDVFFVMGYALLWIGLFAAVRKGLLRWVVLILFHATAIFVVMVKTIAYQYIQETGTTLDYTIIRLWLPRVDELGLMLGQGIPPSAWLLLVATLCYVTLGPLLVTRFVARWRGWERGSPLSGRPERIPILGSLVLCLLALAFVSLSLQEGFNPYNEYLRLTDQESEAVVH